MKMISQKLRSVGWKPTPELIGRCEAALVAKAHRDTVEPIVKAYQTAILAAGNYHICEKIQEDYEERQVAEKDTRILDPDRTYLMRDADFELYDAACNEATKASKLTVSRPGNCPYLEARTFVVQAENALLRQFAAETGERRFADPMDMTLRKQLLDFVYRMVVPHLDAAEVIQRARRGVTAA